MRHCEGIPIENQTLKANAWPAVIDVDRGLLDDPSPNCVRFGRRGTLRFFVSNGYAVYQKMTDRPGGWVYKLLESNLERDHPP